MKGPSTTGEAPQQETTQMTAREMITLFMMGFLSPVWMMEMLIVDHPFPYKSPPARMREQLPSGRTSMLGCRLSVIDRIRGLSVTAERA